MKKNEKKSKMKKTLLAIGISVCLLIACLKIYKFYEAHQPPFAVGECFSVSDPKLGEVKFTVVENNKKDATTIAIGEVDLVLFKVSIPIKASFQDIRDSGAKKVDCQ